MSASPDPATDSAATDSAATDANNTEQTSQAPVSAFIFVCVILTLLFSLYLIHQVKKVKLLLEDDALSGQHYGSNGLLTHQDGDSASSSTSSSSSSERPGGGPRPSTTSELMVDIYLAIRKGADAFLFAEYIRCCVFVLLFGTLVLLMTSRVRDEECSKNSVDNGSENNSDAADSCEPFWNFKQGSLTALSFVVGCITSMLSGYIGMKVATYANARTAVSSANAQSPFTFGFNTAFQAGACAGFCLVGLALGVLYVLCLAYNTTLPYTDGLHLFEAITGFGLGGSSIALFGRVGGGIYTKAADVGADLAGKVVSGIPEDDPRNPATIADNVGDNVGDVAGMGADLFGSLAEASCAALVISQSSVALVSAGWTALLLPTLIAGLGILVCIVVTFVATHIRPVKKEEDIESALKLQLLLTAIGVTIFLFPIVNWSLPGKFEIQTLGKEEITGSPAIAYGCAILGLWAGTIIGFVTEYYTSHSYSPTQEVARSAETGSATTIIYGISLGYKSAVVPVVLIAAVVYISFSVLDMYGVSLAALGMLSTLPTCLAIDIYGPISDNAGGIAEMSGMHESVREVTDALDAAGNTTAAVGKGFAIGSACLVGLALLGAFAKRVHVSLEEVSLLQPVVFSFLLIGALIPYVFAAMTMRSVGEAANEMVKEVARQFREIEGLLEGAPGHAPPDHERCIDISTKAALREMIAPGLLVMGMPLAIGIFFGTSAVIAYLSGAIASSVQLAISMSNSGGAWDNAKKYVEKGEVMVDGVVQGKGTEVHAAAVTGDTVGDPFKDTSGPALNIVMKLSSVLALVFADFFLSINDGHGLIRS